MRRTTVHNRLIAWNLARNYLKHCNDRKRWKISIGKNNNVGWGFSNRYCASYRETGLKFYGSEGEVVAWPDKVQGSSVPALSMKAYQESRSISPLILNLGISGHLHVLATLHSPQPPNPEKTTVVPTAQTAGNLGILEKSKTS